ncbi:hypothetical protein OTB20_15235 [Streptomyces sp. H27-H1]|uniref:hypothetical protein n=1 Tax=Streptomyces sp. H27-H1 TaxID=2996461 RepID=UPI00226FEB46|nr:hypothetical protein [Streptomyces sp. H27-H1]MCY0927539.1 hypothetical protein [Streptomyces sp. H27-H1]
MTTKTRPHVKKATTTATYTAAALAAGLLLTGCCFGSLVSGGGPGKTASADTAVAGTVTAVEVADARSGSIEVVAAESSSGRVTVAGVAAAGLATSSGSVRADRIAGPLKVRTSAGSTSSGSRGITLPGPRPPPPASWCAPRRATSGSRLPEHARATVDRGPRRVRGPLPLLFAPGERPLGNIGARTCIESA